MFQAYLPHLLFFLLYLMFIFASRFFHHSTWLAFNHHSKRVTCNHIYLKHIQDHTYACKDIYAHIYYVYTHADINNDIWIFAVKHKYIYMHIHHKLVFIELFAYAQHIITHIHQRTCRHAPVTRSHKH